MTHHRINLKTISVNLDPVCHPIFIISSKYTSHYGLSVLQPRNFSRCHSYLLTSVGTPSATALLQHGIQFLLPLKIVPNHFLPNCFQFLVLYTLYSSGSAILYLSHSALNDNDNDTIRSLRNSQPFPSIRARTNKFHKSFLPYCLKNFT